jgi:DNA-directed RNA polymerase subunit H (RpoH/RPB5)
MNTLEDQIKTSRKVIIEMLTDREYNTTNIDPHIPDMLFATLFSQFENEPFGHAMGPFDFNCENFTGDKIYIKYIHKHKKKTGYINFEKLHKKVKNIHDILFNDQVIYIICDTNDEDIEENEKIINVRKKKNVEVFDIKRLMINITKHFIVPKHEKISIEDVHTLKKTLRIKDIYKLPALMIYDPVARYFNFKQGDVIKITRNSKSTGIHVSYRACIENEEVL